ncbi:MAG TPA: hypothetical protein VMW41_05570 [Candidatus Bathyarchaeia archaeon]|nr:hypothetical protein [Candidatus Bathyarchaeia archaeon]
MTEEQTENQTNENSGSEFQKEDQILHQLDQKEIGWGKALTSALVILLIIAAGVGSGYFLSRRGLAAGDTVTKRMISGNVEVISGNKEVGIKDERSFRDTTQGKIEANDSAEVKQGSHKLLRVGGNSQTVFLTSSVVDLDQFVGQCVQVWGETFSSQDVGWLMDIGRVKVMDKCPEDL